MPFCGSCHKSYTRQAIGCIPVDNACKIAADKNPCVLLYAYAARLCGRSMICFFALRQYNGHTTGRYDLSDHVFFFFD